MRPVGAKRALFLAVSACILAGCAGGYNLPRREAINIYVEKPESREVYFFSSLDGFKPHPAEKQPDGRWMVTTPAGHEFSYFFTADGEHYLPPCRFKESDGYGSRNCVHSP